MIVEAEDEFLAAADTHYKSLEDKLIEEHLEEIIDENGHFVRVPSVNPKLYPSRTTAIEILSNLQAISKTKVFVEPKYIAFENYYFISKLYIERLCYWLVENEDSAPNVDLSVDNSHFFEKRSATSTNLNTFIVKFCQIVNEDCWNHLMD